MKPEAQLTPAYARTKRRIKQYQEDQARGSLVRTAVQNVTISPVATSQWCGGPLWIYEADDPTLLENGLVQACDLPEARTGCKTHRWVNRDLIRTYRMSDGRVRLTISANLVRQHDAGFVDFLARTVGDAIIQQAAGGVRKE